MVAVSKRVLGWVQGGVSCAIRARSVWGVGGVAVERGRVVRGFKGKRTGRRRRHLAALENLSKKVTTATGATGAG